MQTLTQPLANQGSTQKIIFRFCFIYFATYILLNPNNEIPLINLFYESFNNILHQFIPWFAKTFFGYKQPITAFTNGSGDTTYDYILWFFGIIISLLGTVIWTLLDRKRGNYNTLYYWLNVLLRYFLFYTMITYGMFKVIKLQFPFPTLNRLVQPYGDSSPMGLAWTYMGYSTSYNYFTGIAELLAGVLLIFRRTSTLGALVCLGVMTNVFMINISYDVPVKLLSLNTILMSLFLLRKDAKRLCSFFVSNKNTEAANISLPYSNKKMRYSMLALKILFIGFIVIVNLTDAFTAQKEYGNAAPKASLYGIYNTETIIKNKDTLPRLINDTTSWKRIIVQWQNYAYIRLNNDTTRNYSFKIDTTLKTITAYPNWDTVNRYQFKYINDSMYLVLNGTYKNDSLHIKLKRFDENKFRLANRGFHWVNEYPFNR
jgi:uncharacterized membrane protein YphA (DoxX/SURF4 family)